MNVPDPSTNGPTSAEALLAAGAPLLAAVVDYADAAAAYVDATKALDDATKAYADADAAYVDATKALDADAAYDAAYAEDEADEVRIAVGAAAVVIGEALLADLRRALDALHHEGGDRG